VELASVKEKDSKNAGQRDKLLTVASQRGSLKGWIA
jgi:hypothetical protein